MKNMKKHAIYALSAIALCAATQTFAATAASSMHYGMPHATTTTLKTQDGPIVITNCTDEQDLVSAWFTDGSSNINMPIYPQSQYPMNVISIDNSYPYVNIEVDALDGTVLYPNSAVYPGQNVNIGCGATLATKSNQHPSVTVTGK